MKYIVRIEHQDYLFNDPAPGVIEALLTARRVDSKDGLWIDSKSQFPATVRIISDSEYGSTATKDDLLEVLEAKEKQLAEERSERWKAVGRVRELESKAKETEGVN